MSAAPRETSAMPREHHLPVTRTARFYTLGPPSGAPKQLWIACHGYGQLAARFISHFAVIDDGSRVIAAPEALSRFYLGGETGSSVRLQSVSTKRLAAPGSPWLGVDVR